MINVCASLELHYGFQKQALQFCTVTLQARQMFKNQWMLMVCRRYLCFKAMPKLGDSSQCNLHDFMRLWTVLRTGLRHVLLELLEMVHQSTKLI